LLEELQGRTIHEDSKSGHAKSRKEQGKITVDAVAAAVILKEYLQQRQQPVQITTSEASN
jgi:RNase H-fold protein (predicted Holliday junction resolvase)